MPEHPDTDPQEGEWESILLDAFALVHGDRGEAYGPPWEDYARTCEMFTALFPDRDLSVPEGLLFMVSVKLSRLAYGLEVGLHPDMLRDSITDACGYLDCLWGSITVGAPADDDDDDDGGDDEDPEPLPLPDGGDAEKVAPDPPLLTAETEPIHEPDDDDQDVDITSNEAPPVTCN
jgi:hypothetical protein